MLKTKSDVMSNSEDFGIEMYTIRAKNTIRNIQKWLKNQDYIVIVDFGFGFNRNCLW